MLILALATAAIVSILVSRGERTRNDHSHAGASRDAGCRSTNIAPGLEPGAFFAIADERNRTDDHFHAVSSAGARLAHHLLETIEPSTELLDLAVFLGEE